MSVSGPPLPSSICLSLSARKAGEGERDRSKVGGNIEGESRVGMEEMPGGREDVPGRKEWGEEVRTGFRKERKETRTENRLFSLPPNKWFRSCETIIPISFVI